jgi:hypothetical protein
MRHAGLGLDLASAGSACNNVFCEHHYQLLAKLNLVQPLAALGTLGKPKSKRKDFLPSVCVVGG